MAMSSIGESTWESCAAGTNRVTVSIQSGNSKGSAEKSVHFYETLIGFKVTHRVEILQHHAPTPQGLSGPAANKK